MIENSPDRDKGLHQIAVEIARLRHAMLVSFAVFSAVGFFTHMHPVFLVATVVFTVLAITEGKVRGK